MIGIKKRIRGVIASVIAAAMTVTLLMPGAAFADSSRIVTLGVDLSSDQRATVLKFFNLTEGDLKNMEVIDVNNKDERRYLEGTLSDDIIGYKTYSCSYLEPKTSGGLHVETANLTYVTKNTLYNALQTAGVENCSLVVTAPFPVSGTGALTGVFMAYEKRGVRLDEKKKDAATNELVQTAQLEGKYGEPVAEVISDVKNKVVSDKSQLTDDQIRDLIKEAAKLKGIDISDADIDSIMSIVQKVQGLDYDLNAFSNTLDEFKKALDGANGKAQEATSIFDAIGQFFQGIIDWFTNLFNGGTNSKSSSSNSSTGTSDSNKKSNEKSSDSLISDLNTDVFTLDSGDATEKKTTETKTTDTASASDTRTSDQQTGSATPAESTQASEPASQDRQSENRQQTTDDNQPSTNSSSQQGTRQEGNSAAA